MQTQGQLLGALAKTASAPSIFIFSLITCWDRSSLFVAFGAWQVAFNRPHWRPFQSITLWLLYGRYGAALHLNITVISGSIGGLAATHMLAHARNHVMIPMSACMLGDVGVGIQVITKVTWLLLHWGLCPTLCAYGIKPTVIIFR